MSDSSYFPAILDCLKDLKKAIKCRLIWQRFLFQTVETYRDICLATISINMSPSYGLDVNNLY